jgi:anti-sigma28 factor (negative regulator of flagellin synthesis)
MQLSASGGIPISRGRINAMTNDNDVEKLLQNVPRAHVRAGRHRDDLKTRLLLTPCNEEPKMKTRTWKWAIAACCTAVLLSAVGWAAQQGYLNFKQFIVEETEGEKTILPDGSSQSSKTTVSVSTNDPNVTQETANQHWQEIKKAVEKGRYQLTETKKTDEGFNVYIYSVMLEDGTQDTFASSKFLDAPKKTAEQQHQEIKQAIEKGRYKLLKTQKINGINAYHYLVTLEDGTQVGYGTMKPLPELQP